MKTLSGLLQREISFDLDGEKVHGVDIEFRTTDAGDADGKILTVGTVAEG